MCLHSVHWLYEAYGGNSELIVLALKQLMNIQFTRGAFKNVDIWPEVSKHQHFFKWSLSDPSFQSELRPLIQRVIAIYFLLLLFKCNYPSSTSWKRSQDLRIYMKKIKMWLYKCAYLYSGMCVYMYVYMYTHTHIYISWTLIHIFRN
jgi:hypothetical protein